MISIDQYFVPQKVVYFPLLYLTAIRPVSSEDILNSYQASIKMAPFEALYGRKCRSPICWDDIGERKLMGPDILVQTIDKVRIIRDHLREAQSRQKSWAYTNRRPLEFRTGDHVFLRISPIKGIIRFGARGKLSPRYIGPFEILDRVEMWLTDWHCHHL